MVEAAQASVAGSVRDLRHGKHGLVEQPLGEMKPARLRDGDGRRADVTQEQAVKVTRSYADARSQLFDDSFVQRAVVNEPQRTADDRGGAEPRGRAGRRLGPAAQAGPEAGSRGGGGGRVVADVRALAGRRWADRAAIDAGRRSPR